MTEASSAAHKRQRHAALPRAARKGARQRRSRLPAAPAPRWRDHEEVRETALLTPRAPPASLLPACVATCAERDRRARDRASGRALDRKSSTKFTDGGAGSSLRPALASRAAASSSVRPPLAAGVTRLISVPCLAASSARLSVCCCRAGRPLSTHMYDSLCARIARRAAACARRLRVQAVRRRMRARAEQRYTQPP